MRKLTLERLGIGLFCLTLIGGGLLTIMPHCKAIVKQTLTSMTKGYQEQGSLEGLLEGAISGFESSISEHIYGREAYINLYGLSERLLGHRYIKDVNPLQDVVKDSNGQLQFLCYKVDTMPYVEEIDKVNQLAQENSIPLLYVQTPLKMIEGYSQIPEAIVDYAESNTDRFMDQLASKNIETLDLREKVEEDQLEKSLLFYNTDHHWRTQTAFWGVDQVVSHLNEVFSMDLDENNFFTDLNHYTQTIYENSFLGSQGRRVGKYYESVDDYTLITPNFETDYEVTINKGNSSTVTEGSFEETIVKKSFLKTKDVYTNRYAAYFGGDFPEVIIKNKLVSNNMKVLVLKDSFALPFTAFFSVMVSETRMLDTRYYTESVEDYIDAYQPDLILYVYKSINTQK